MIITNFYQLGEQYEDFSCCDTVLKHHQIGSRAQWGRKQNEILKSREDLLRIRQDSGLQGCKKCNRKLGGVL